MSKDKIEKEESLEGSEESKQGEMDAQSEERRDEQTDDVGSRYKISGMFREWFLDYASYVILERAVPHLEDGLKPVQRRILHAMKLLDDGRYNKVANIIGHTMQFHPHGDASIGNALVQLGQKDLMIDCQGNWGNVHTGDEAAAPRYIEARLTPFALDVVFNAKTTEWMKSYDGRNNEPVTLPVKFPLLLTQGVEGIAVGLASRILPHNFNELVDGCIAYLKEKEFELMPDFQTGGIADCSRYNDGLRGGQVKVRARIAKIDNRTLRITEIPYGTTTESIKDSIVRANEREKIKIRKVDDNTAENVDIIVHVATDESADRTIDALYAFTDCEVSISPNSCVIYEDKPVFMGVSDILKRSADDTRGLLKRELEIRLDELNEAWHMSSLERIFIENKIYQAIEGKTSRDAAYKAVDEGLEPFKKLLRREVTMEDVQKLTELRFIRISRYDSSKAEEKLAAIEAEMKEVKNNLENLTDYTVAYYREIKRKYGKGRERRTELREFEGIDATRVIAATEKLYVDRKEGFFGIGRSMNEEEFVCECSDIDEVILIAKDGKYLITRVSDKAFFAKDIYYIGVIQRNDERTIYNMLYRDGKGGAIMMKRCAITSFVRDREYDLTKGTPNSEILYLSVNPNGEAEVLKIYFRPRPRLRNTIQDLDFGELEIRGQHTQGNIFTRYGIQKIVLKEEGVSTLSGIKIWYDNQIRKLNIDEHGEYLGEFSGDDKIVVLTSKGEYYTTKFDVAHHFPVDTIRVDKFDPERIYSVAHYDGDQEFFYLKRFPAEESEDRMQDYINRDNPQSQMIELNADFAPMVEVSYKGEHDHREPDQIDVEEFIGVKSHRARGKRITTYEVDKVKFIEPRIKEAPKSEGSDNGGDEGDGEGSEKKAETKNGVKNSESKAKKKAIIKGEGITFEVEESTGEDEKEGNSQLDLF